MDIYRYINHSDKEVTLGTYTIPAYDQIVSEELIEVLCVPQLECLINGLETYYEVKTPVYVNPKLATEE